MVPVTVNARPSPCLHHMMTQLPNPSGTVVVVPSEGGSDEAHDVGDCVAALRPLMCAVLRGKCSRRVKSTNRLPRRCHGHRTSEGGRKGSGGTGSIIQADGLVLTNAHVVIEERIGKPHPRLSVFLKPARVTGDLKVDRSRIDAHQVVAFSTPLDLALLKREGAPAALPVVALSESSQEKIGDRVVAIGHPEQGAGRSRPTIE